VLCGLLLVPTACTLVAGLGDPKILGAASPDATSDVQALTIAMGGTHGCAVVQGPPESPENGTVRCWGANGSGELGSDPAVVPSSAEPLPVQASDGQGLFGGASAVTALTAGTGYSCGITTDGYFYCWGTIPEVATTGVHPTMAGYAPSPMDLNKTAFLQVTTAAVGDDGGCVIDTATGSPNLVCWGGATFSTPECGQSGIACDAGGVGIAPDTFEALAIGESHACGIATRAGVRDVECWGANDHGQAGDGPETVSYPNPIGVAAFGTIVDVASGGNHSCALVNETSGAVTTGVVYCWGQNDLGQLGDPSVAGDSFSPLRVAFALEATESMAPSALEIAVGTDHACALMSDESTQCWGDDSRGQLGDGKATGFQAQPVTVERVQDGGVNTLPRGTHLAAGGATTCEIRWGDPQIWCWGANESGQAGQPGGPDAGAAVVPYATPMAW
jgi:alpha-tubulin suppressor-like RCC1 family protein